MTQKGPKIKIKLTLSTKIGLHLSKPWNGNLTLFNDHKILAALYQIIKLGKSEKRLQKIYGSTLIISIIYSKKS